MNYLSFQQQFLSQGIVYHRDIYLIEPDFDPRQLTRWAKKGYIQKLIDGYRVFTSALEKSGIKHAIANRLYEPSYLSLERGLMYYGLIPEYVFQRTSVSTKKTKQVATPVGNFSYQTIKPTLFFGYDLVRMGDQQIRIGQLEKVLLDYLYLHPRSRQSDDFDELRLNILELSHQLDRQRFHGYAQLYPKTTQHHAKVLLMYIDAHA